MRRKAIYVYIEILASTSSIKAEILTKPTKGYGKREGRTNCVIE